MNRPKFYDLETLTQEDLNKLALERNILANENGRLHSIIKEVREYITSYESIEAVNQVEHNENNKGLDEKTMIEMINRHLRVHDKILEILDKVGDINDTNINRN